MENLTGKKFIVSYSGGKDSVLALNRAISTGLIPLYMMTVYRTDAERSWWHGLSEELLMKVSESISIPLKIVKTSGDDYTLNFEKALTEAKNQGAEVVVFGDIDIPDHLDWCSERCINTGLIPYFPLGNEDRKKLVYEFIDLGFFAIIKIVDTTRLDEKFLGQILTREIVDEIEAYGADACGEYGEYHTFVFDGPLFTEKIDFNIAERFKDGNSAIIHIV